MRKGFTFALFIFIVSICSFMACYIENPNERHRLENIYAKCIEYIKKFNKKMIPVFKIRDKICVRYIYGNEEESMRLN